MIGAERERQMIGKGYTVEHDDAHDRGQLVAAAMCYLALCIVHVIADRFPKFNIASLWPWNPAESYPRGERHAMLVKAGALIAAELDRVRRAEAIERATLLNRRLGHRD